MKLDANIIFTQMTNSDTKLEIHKISEKYNSTQGKTICIISNSEPIVGINTYAEKLIQTFKSHKLR